MNSSHYYVQQVHLLTTRHHSLCATERSLPLLVLAFLRLVLVVTALALLAAIRRCGAFVLYNVSTLLVIVLVSFDQRRPVECLVVLRGQLIIDCCGHYCLTSPH